MSTFEILKQRLLEMINESDPLEGASAHRLLLKLERFEEHVLLKQLIVDALAGETPDTRARILARIDALKRRGS